MYVNLEIVVGPGVDGACNRPVTRHVFEAWLAVTSLAQRASESGVELSVIHLLRRLEFGFDGKILIEKPESIEMFVDNRFSFVDWRARAYYQLKMDGPVQSIEEIQPERRLLGTLFSPNRIKSLGHVAENKLVEVDNLLGKTWKRPRLRMEARATPSRNLTVHHRKRAEFVPAALATGAEGWCDEILRGEDESL
ncbi:hypothetical protein JW916_05625 [Candidatus Sumerlaeota bacterium]|nr:hypothetical protein [Candidatus Sumerlaeota bacterium]